MKTLFDLYTTPADGTTAELYRAAVSAQREWVASEDALEKALVGYMASFKAAIQNGALDELIDRVEYTDEELEL